MEIIWKYRKYGIMEIVWKYGHHIMWTIIILPTCSYIIITLLLFLVNLVRMIYQM